MSPHVVPVRVYVGIFVALLFLTGLTTAVAFVDLGPLNTVVALAIAVVKMLLVILFFMHVRNSSGLTRIVILAGFFWLAILITLTLSDVLTRQWTPRPSGWDASEIVTPR
jgi:cytochrome c oxidase subunit 4